MKQFIKGLLLTLLASCLAMSVAFTAVATDVQPVHMDDITVVSKLTGDTPSTSKTFTFAISSDSGAPLPDSTSVSIKGAGSATFGDIEYTEADIYEYTVKQTTSGTAHYAVDTVTYNLLVYVVYDSDNALYVKAIYATASSNPDAKVASLTFTNKYTAPVVVYPTAVPTEEPSPSPSATRTPIVPVVSPTPTPVAEATPTPTATAAVAAVATATPAAEETATPEEPTGILQDPVVPLAGLLSNGEAWAWVNLALAIGTVLGSVLMLVGYFINRKANDDGGEDTATTADDQTATTNRKNKGFARLFSIAPAVFSVVLFILTEDMSLPMVTLDSWTIPMVLIALVQVFVAITARKKDETQEPKKGA